MSENEPNNPQYNPNIPPQNYYGRNRRKSRWWIPVAIIGGVILLFIIFIVAVFSAIGGAFSDVFAEEKVDIKSNSILYVTLSGGMQEYSSNNPFAKFTGGSRGDASFLETMNAIKRAATDDKIKGIYIKPSLSSIGSAKLQELNEVMTDFKKSGKFIYAFMEVGAENNYLTCLPADSIFMPTEGMLEMNGYNVTGVFAKNLFDKIGINFHVEHFEDFKSASEMYNRTNFSDSARYQLKVLLQQRYNYLVNSISYFRKMETANVESILNRGVYTADSLKALGLVDVLATENTVREFLKFKAMGKNFNFSDYSKNNLSEKESKSNKLYLVSPATYLNNSSSHTKEIIYDENTRIAIINAVGAISSGKSSDAFGSDYEIKSGDIVSYLKDAREDDKVKIIILRIDSPGGSVIASDEIWEEIQKTRKVKPVYASMGDVAASGGYYMAMACDTIIAHPSTITGSIGVVLAVPNVTGLMGKIGISVDTVSTGPAAQFMNGSLPFDQKSVTQLHNLSESIYFRFLSRVAESRKKTFDEIRAVAKGRVWTGEDARRIGLVDTLGGLNTAIAMAKARLGISQDTKVMVQSYPEKKDEFETLIKMFGSNNEGDDNEAKTKIELAKKFGLDYKTFIDSWEVVPEEIRNAILYNIKLAEISQKEHALVAMPESIYFR